MSEAIAIVGMACRFPGAETPEAYWKLLHDGVDAVTEVPAGRWDSEALFDPNPDAAGKIYAQRGAFLDHVDEFDAAFFGISPREASSMDPQQRLLLEMTWEALESAGQPPHRLSGSQTGVFVGISTNDYAAFRGDLTEIDPYTGTGNAFSVAAGRISYLLGLHGPNLPVDTACSSSLVAIHLACRSLASGECSLALAGGVNLILTPDTTAYLCRLRALAPDGRCKTYDAAADGYVRGEGCGVIVLKRLADALRDRDRVLAVIRGTAINHDGRSNGLTAPNGLAQEAVIRAALLDARLAPAEVGYVEGHGTGTPLGDTIELQALGAAMNAQRHPDKRLVVGSVKTNFGHLEAAAGIAGLIKIVLALRHAEIPPHLHFKSPNPHVPWQDLRFDVPRRPMPWPSGYSERIAGVSSFGISGTNAHIVLSQAPPAELHPQLQPDTPSLLPLSARTLQSLRSLAQAYRDIAPTAALADLCYTAAVRRSHYEHRLALHASSTVELDARLAAFLANEQSPGLWTGVALAGEPRKVVFVFPGQGGQWAGMGRELCASEPVFREAIEQCDRAMRPFVDWSLIDALAQDPWEQIDRVQPAVFAVQIALAALWRSWGILPDAVIGHSMGEVAAACVAGALSLDEAACIICRRSLLLRKVSGQGAMAIIELSLPEARARIAGFEDHVSIAVSNSPRSTVLSGAAAALDRILKCAEAQGIFCRWVKVDVASHSPQMDAIRAELLDALEGLHPCLASVPFCSTVTGEMAAGPELDASYWVRNLRQPVLFGDAVQRLAADNHDVFLELSPHPILGPAVADNLRELGRDGAILASLRRNEPERPQMLSSLGELYALGHSVTWEGVYPAGGNVATLPAYPWQRERFWLSPVSPRQRSHVGGHPLLGHRIEWSGQPGAFVWQAEISLESLPYLASHRLGAVVVLPAAAYAEMALSAARQLWTEPSEIRSLTFLKMLTVPEQGSVILQLTLSPGSSFEISSRPADGAEWTRYATGSMARSEPIAATPIALDEARARCSDQVDGPSYYEALAEQGLPYGPEFRRIREIWRTAGESLAVLEGQADPGYTVHPALLDACFQAFGACFPAGGESPYLPVSVDKLQAFERPSAGEVTVHAQLTGETEGDLCLLSADGRLLLEARGFRVRRLEPEKTAADPLHDWLYEIEWRAQLIQPKQSAGDWLIYDGSGTARAIADRLIARGATCSVFGPALNEAALRPCRGIVFLSGPGGDSVDSALWLVQTLARMGWRDTPRLFLVTHGCQSVKGEPSLPHPAVLWGFGRTLALEHSEFAPTLIDITGASELDALCGELCGGSPETQVALRGDDRYVARLVRRAQEPQAPLAPAGARDFRLEIDNPGVLDRLQLRVFGRPEPGPGEVAIEIRAAGLNFLDVLAAMGVRPDQPPGAVRLGGECSGVIAAVGSGVEGWRIGDEVIAVAANCFGTRTNALAELVIAKPESLNFAEAATIPIAFLTAYYALHHAGRVQPGERVLIHSASGGVGLAAVQVCRWLRAEILATAGSPDKRQYLRSIGIDRVMDSRSLAFAQEAGEVDVVLNSLTGDAISKSLEILAPYGRFLEIGKKDVYANRQLGLLPFRKNLTYALIDLARMLVERPSLCASLLRQVMDLFRSGAFTALPHRVFPIAQAVDALHEMAQARHTGKLVLSLEHRVETPVVSAATASAVVLPDASYLITGGLGGLGLGVAEWMAEQGARHLVLIGRSGASESAQHTIVGMRARGAQVSVARVDVSDSESLRQLIEGLRPPLAGVIHAAGVLEDSTLLKLDSARMHRVLAPKVAGAWNLHTLTRESKLDFFVLYSSGSGILGTPGQAAYAAGNAFLDALAQHRRSQGLPALSIAWGPFSEAGMVAGAVASQRLANRGMGALTPAQGLEFLDRLLAGSPAYTAVLPLNLRQWRETNPRSANLPFFAELIASGEQAKARASDHRLRDALLAADPKGRTALLEQHVREQVAAVLRSSPDRIGARVPFNTLGMDSLMGLELRNRIEDILGLRLPATLVWQHPAVAALSSYLMELLYLPTPAEPEPQSPSPASTLDRIAELSDEEVDRLLAEKIARSTG